MRLFVIFIISFLFSFLPVVTFLIGISVGQNQVVVISRPDGRMVMQLPHNAIGTVAGVFSVREEIIAEPEIANQQVITNVSVDIFDVVNEYRTKQGLSAFIKDADLCVFVQDRLADLRSRGSIDNHEGFGPRSEFYFKEKSFSNLAENLAQGYGSAAAVVYDGWDLSAPHKSTLLSTQLDRACVVFDQGVAVLIAGAKW